MNSIAAWIDNSPVIPDSLKTLPKVLWLGILAALIAVIAVAYMWLQDTNYQPLFSNLEDQDGGAVVSVLNQKNIPYKFANNGSTIMVPADQVYQLRLEMAEQGLPRGGNIGFELLDEPKFGVSQFAEQINYQRALEGELARSIEALHSVEKARVHLAIPRQSLFVRDREHPTASVLLNLYPGRSLNSSQVNAIAWLVSSSVPKLNAAAVSIVDQDGYLLSDSSDRTGTDSNNRKLTQEIEQRTTQRILTLLNPIVGSGNVRAQVNATLDFSEREETSEYYKPNQLPGTAAVRSRQTSSSLEDSLLPSAGVPGALTNQPPANPQAPIVQNQQNTAQDDQENPEDTVDQPNKRGSSSNQETINYELDRTINHVKYETGVLTRLSVAVVVNYVNKDGEAKPLEQQEMDKLEKLVKQAMGYSGERGDTVSIINSAFTDQEPAYEIWENPKYIAMAIEALKILGYIVALLLVWSKIIRPIINSFNSVQIQKNKQKELENLAHEKGLQEKARQAEIGRYEDNLKTAKELAANDPRAVVMVLRSWMDTEDGKTER